MLFFVEEKLFKSLWLNIMFLGYKFIGRFKKMSVRIVLLNV